MIEKSKISNEVKVGALGIFTVFLAFVFAWVLGINNPFSKSIDFYLTYQFAGGIEVGSPVRVSGIKVGRVERIEFFAGQEASKDPLKSSEASDPTQEVIPLRLKISVRKDAAKGVKQDSKFFINLAGIIGERYIEITPGTRGSPEIKTGETYVGVDPPRIDQLFSQSFNLASKIQQIIEENKGDLTKSIELLYKLSGNINKTLGAVEKSKLFSTDLALLVNNLIQITTDVRKITDKAHTPEGEKTLKLLHELLWRLEPLDSKNIREFLQKEGVRVRIF